ncbi:MAG: AIR synthase-related protein, partial [Balneolaceae bacterium]|nr:AIR synthase-related protein [Balneolaceae bacterium]
MAEASGCGFTVESLKILVGEAPSRIAKLFGIDHRFCVGAGSMIMAVKAGKEHELIQHLENHSIPASVVGAMTEKEEGFKLIENGEEKDFSFDGNDPYWAAYFKAMEAGWK